jgi:hypothetical protein
MQDLLLSNDGAREQQAAAGGEGEVLRTRRRLCMATVNESLQNESYFILKASQRSICR